MPQTIRLAAESDAKQIQGIYAPFCSHTPVSFELTPPSVDEMRLRIAKILAEFPWLVCENRGEILGYVYASRHRERPAYQWSVDATVYIDAQHRRKGIGRALYTSLFEVLRLQGLYHAYAGITLPNSGSVGLHEAMGFQPVGVYRAVGFKGGAWHDVGWWQLELQPLVSTPVSPKSFQQVRKAPQWPTAMQAGVSMLHRQ
jgi:L-amino acid N-acyltransferase YncA